MNNESFDNHIRDQFKSFEPEVPAHIWENIAREKKRRRPGFAWWTPANKMLVLLLATIATGAAIWYEIKSPETAPVRTSIQSTTAPNSTSTSTIANSPVNTNNNFTEKQMQASKGESIGHQTPSVASTGYVPNQNPTTKAINASGYFKTNTITALAESNNETSTIEDAGNNSLLTGSVYYYADRISINAKQPFNLVNLKHGKMPTPCPELERNTAANKKYFELYAGPDYNMTNYSDTGNSNYKQLRQASTKTAFGFSAGARYTKVFGNGMSIRAGINYSEVNEKFTYKQGNYVQVVYIINNNGDTTGSYSVTGTRFKNSRNVYRMADIPVVIGYEMGNERIHVNVNAGVIVNVHSWQKGNVVDTANKPVDISSGSNSPYSFKTNAGVGFIGGASFYYKLNDKLHLMAEPYFRYNLSQANKPGITLKQKFSTAGVRLGVRIDIP